MEPTQASRREASRGQEDGVGNSEAGNSEVEEATRRVRAIVEPRVAIGEEEEGGEDNANGQRRKKKKKIFHSLNNANKRLGHYHGLVPEGIKREATKRGIVLDNGDLLKLEKFRGDFPYYIPWESKEGESIPKLRQCQDKSKEEIKTVYEAKNRYLCDASPRFSPNLAPKTSANYERSIRSMWNFLAFLGRYSEMILLLPNAPQIPDDVVPSITPETIVEFVHHRFQVEGEPLKLGGLSTAPQVHDINGVPVQCEGAVKNQDWMDSLFASVSYIHDKALKGNKYVPPCLQCIEENGDSPCEAHRRSGRSKVHYTRSQGDPTKSKKIDELKGWLKKVSEERRYKPKRRSPFLPDDLNQFHAALDRKNYDIVHLARFTALVLACHVGGRYDGYSNITFENFNKTTEHWLVTETGIHSFAFDYMEKTDKEHYQYRCQFQDAVPIWCWARLILVYIHCSGITSGFVFACEAELKEARQRLLSGNENGHEATKTMDYEKFKKHIDWLKQFCKAPDLANWGPHSPRCTSYLLNFMGGASERMACKTARHKSIDVAMKYVGETHAVRDLIRSHPTLRELHKVPPFRDKMITGDGQGFQRTLATLPGRNRSHNKITNLAKFFVETQLGVRPGNPHYRDPEYLLRKSYNMTLDRIAPSPDDMHIEQIKALVPENQQCLLLQSYDQESQKAKKKADLEKERAVQEQQRISHGQMLQDIRRDTQLQAQDRDANLQWQRQLRESMLSEQRKWQSEQERKMREDIKKWWAENRDTWTSLTQVPRELPFLGTNTPTRNETCTGPREQEDTRTRPQSDHTQILNHESPTEPQRVRTERAAAAIPNNESPLAQETWPASAMGGHPTSTVTTREVDHITPSPPQAFAEQMNEVTRQQNNPYTRRQLKMTVNTPTEIPVENPQPIFQIPLHSGRILNVTVSATGEMNALLSETRQREIRQKGGKEKADMLLDLLLEIAELCFDDRKTHQQCYDEGKQILYNSLPNRKARGRMQTYVNRTLKPLEHHFFVCCRGHKPTFLEKAKTDFTPKDFISQVQCEPCLREALEATNSARRNAKKQKRTLDDIRQGSPPRQRQR